MTSTWLLALTGGVLIGPSATFLLWLNGHVAGVSGILNGVAFSKYHGVAWRVAFLLVLVVAVGLYMALVPGAPQPRMDFSLSGLVVAGLVVQAICAIRFTGGTLESTSSDGALLFGISARIPARATGIVVRAVLVEAAGKRRERPLILGRRGSKRRMLAAFS